MRLAWVLPLLVLVGCTSSTPLGRDSAQAELFGPSAVRIHPIFTEIKDWTGDNVPDGVDALVEFQDQFGDPTKASGTLTFELFEYRQADPDPRGRRLAYWTGSILTLEDQRQRWNRTSRTYGFQLAYPGISTDKSYVLSVTFQSAAGGRLFDRLVLERQAPQKPQTRPTTQPAL